MAKIPFDIKFRPQIESGEYKVETSDGCPARIICWDSPINEDRPIICIVYDNQIEQYKADGRYDYETCNYDLIIITPEPELSEFEDAVGAEIFDPPFNEEQIKVIKEESAKLLALARKEMEEELKEKVLHDYWKQASDQCIQARKEGKSEALKDLPRWKICYRSDYDKVQVEEWSNGIIVMYNGYYINITDLFDKLPKEDEK